MKLSLRRESEPPCATPGPEHLPSWLTEEADEQTEPTLAPMTGDQGDAGRDDQDRGRLKILRAADAFDRRDHVMTVAAYQLHVRATASSAADDHPGFVPGEYLASLTGQDLHSPGADPAILATELCAAGLWQRTSGGYRVLDWPAVQACINHVRELRTIDKRAPARQRQHHAWMNAAVPGWRPAQAGQTATGPARVPVFDEGAGDRAIGTCPNGHRRH
jgi:hypothetical protein